MYKFGIDLGGTKIEGAILDLDGSELYRKRIATERGKGYRHILSRLALVYADMVDHVDGGDHTLGVGTPGIISPLTGLLKNSNTTCLNGKPMDKDLAAEIGHALRMENDANCFALAESQLGAARGKDLVFGVILGTGCGGGIVHKGEMLRGRQGISGEWGHMSIDPAGPDCYCGSKGCIETFIGGHGAEGLYRERYGAKLTFRELTERYEAGESAASEFIGFYLDRFGRSIANLINLLDPDIVVLGGGLSKFDALYTAGVDAVRKYIFSDSLETPIVQNQTGDSAGVIGAALIGAKG